MPHALALYGRKPGDAGDGIHFVHGDGIIDERRDAERPRHSVRKHGPKVRGMLHDRTVAQHVEHGIIDTIRPGTHRRQQPTPPHTGVQGRGINAFFRQYVEQQTVAQLKLLHDRRGQFGGIVVAADGGSEREVMTTGAAAPRMSPAT